MILGWWFKTNGAPCQASENYVCLQYSPEPGDWGFAIGCTVAPPNSEGSEVVKRISSKRAVALPSGALAIAVFISLTEAAEH